MHTMKYKTAEESGAATWSSYHGYLVRKGCVPRSVCNNSVLLCFGRIESTVRVFGTSEVAQPVEIFYLSTRSRGRCLLFSLGLPDSVKHCLSLRYHPRRLCCVFAPLCTPTRT